MVLRLLGVAERKTGHPIVSTICQITTSSSTGLDQLRVYKGLQRGQPAAQ